MHAQHAPLFDRVTAREHRLEPREELVGLQLGEKAEAAQVDAEQWDAERRRRAGHGKQGSVAPRDDGQVDACHLVARGRGVPAVVGRGARLVSDGHAAGLEPDPDLLCEARAFGNAALAHDEDLSDRAGRRLF